MRIGELARRSGSALTTIKYYLRVGLLPAGRATAHNQAVYDERQLRRLRLVTVLMSLGGMTVAGARSVLAAVDDPGVTIADLLTVVDAAGIAGQPRGLDEAARAAALRDITAPVARLGWLGRTDADPLDRVVDVCAMARMLEADLCTAFDDYADAAMRLAGCDLAVIRSLIHRHAAARNEAVLREGVVVVVVVSGALQAALCGAARQHLLSLLRRAEAGGPDTGS